MHARLTASFVPALLALCALAGCRDYVDYNSGRIDFEPDRPQIDEAPEVEPYAGDDEIVLLAQERFPTGLDLHKKVIWRTCTPNGGVCHNRKEYPDLHTPANFAQAFSAPCNIQPGEFDAVYDGCERPGDRLRYSGYGFGDEEIEIGWIEYIVGEAEDYGDSEPPPDAPGLHIHLASPIGGEQVRSYGNANFIRSFVDEAGQVQESTYASYGTQWWKVGDGTHIIGQVREYQVDEVQELIGVGIVQGDANRNGTFGSHMGAPVSMLEPGDPLASYLIGRMRGIIHAEELPVPGSRMPLANPPLTVDEMLALFCLVEGFPEDGDSAMLSGPIDYNRCSFSDDPDQLNLLGNGVTWESRVKLILEFNCGGCHNDGDPQGGLTLLGDGVYERLLEPSAQVSDMKLIEPGDPTRSYLYLKLIGDEGIVGLQMPYNPLTGEGSLSQAELADIETWIVQGAVENE